MRIVVTGALGHIGSALIRYLPLEFPECDIVMIDNVYTQRYCSLFDLPKGKYQFIEADACTCVLPPHDVVVHLAAYTEPHAKLNWDHNLYATINIARQAKRLIFPSTLSVLPQPQTDYARMKLREEGWVSDHIILRLGNLFGPSPGMRFHTVVSKLCWQAVNRIPLTVWKTALDQKRPYLDLVDVVRAICFHVGGDYHGAYNLITQTTTLSEVIGHIETHVPVKINFVDDESMNKIDQVLSAKKMERLGFEFVGDLGKGISRTMGMLCHG